MSDFVSAIGIATVSRPQESYLETTLAELFSKASPWELQDVAVIIFLADLDDGAAKNEVRDHLTRQIYFSKVFFSTDRYSLYRFS